MREVYSILLNALIYQLFYTKKERQHDNTIMNLMLFNIESVEDLKKVLLLFLSFYS